MLAAGSTFAHFRIEAELGRGGMGVVLLARDGRLDRLVALKLLPDFAGADAATRDRFRREARAAARLQHPHIVTVFDFIEADGQAALVMEFVPGGTLRHRLGRPFTVAETVALLRPVASALDYAHGLGLVHRDVKPANILLTPDGRPVLSDFGLAQFGESAGPPTLTDSAIGTPDYMAPEQALGGALSSAVDRFALAVIAYELLCGSPPYSGPTPVARLVARVHGPPTPPRSLRPDLPAPIEAVLLAGLARDPAARPASCVALIDALATAGRDPTSAASTRPRRPAQPALLGEQTTILTTRPRPRPNRTRRLWIWLASSGAAAGIAVAAGVGFLAARNVADAPRVASVSNAAATAPEPTPAAAPSPTPAPTRTAMPSPSPAPSPTATPAPSPTATPRPTATPTATATAQSVITRALPRTGLRFGPQSYDPARVVLTVADVTPLGVMQPTLVQRPTDLLSANAVAQFAPAEQAALARGAGTAVLFTDTPAFQPNGPALLSASFVFTDENDARTALAALRGPGPSARSANDSFRATSRTQQPAPAELGADALFVSESGVRLGASSETVALTMIWRHGRILSYVVSLEPRAADSEEATARFFRRLALQDSRMPGSTLR